MTQEELQAIREREQAATPGPWYIDDLFLWGGGNAGKYDDYGDALDSIIAGMDARDGTQVADGAFIAHARTDIPALLDHIAALEAENARMRAVVAAMAKHPMDFDFWTCPFCKAKFVWNMGMEGQHKEDCPIPAARAILASIGGNGNAPAQEEPSTRVSCRSHQPSHT